MENQKKWFTYKETGCAPKAEENEIMLEYIRKIREYLKENDRLYEHIEKLSMLKDSKYFSEKLQYIAKNNREIKKYENKLKQDFNFPDFALRGI